jgi:hypothetical protein
VRVFSDEDVLTVDVILSFLHLHGMSSSYVYPQQANIPLPHVLMKQIQEQTQDKHTTTYTKVQLMSKELKHMRYYNL